MIASVAAQSKKGPGAARLQTPAPDRAVGVKTSGANVRQRGNLMSGIDERSRIKRESILNAAGGLIIERGYDATSLDAVVERAGCSKSAIYELFGNKEGLLHALTEDLALELTRALHAFHKENLGVRETLTRYGRLALELILSAHHTAIVRATIAAAWKHPDIGRHYYAVGALNARTALANYFAEHGGRELVNMSDPVTAAREFQSLLFFERLLAQIAGAEAPPNAAEVEALVNSAVTSFLAIYSQEFA